MADGHETPVARERRAVAEHLLRHARSFPDSPLVASVLRAMAEDVLAGVRPPHRGAAGPLIVERPAEQGKG